MICPPCPLPTLLPTPSWQANPAFVFNQDAAQAGAGSKWTLSAFERWMRGAGHDYDALWAQIQGLVAKSLIAIQPMLQYNVRGSALRPVLKGMRERAN